MDVVKTMFIENRIWVIYKEIQRRKPSFDQKKLLLLFISFSLYSNFFKLQVTFFC